MTDTPPIVCTFALPPLLAVVLDRLNNRADLRQVIADLRAELVPARAELQTFNGIVTQPYRDRYLGNRYIAI
jgi:hypothetical protein